MRWSGSPTDVFAYVVVCLNFFYHERALQTIALQSCWTKWRIAKPSLNNPLTVCKGRTEERARSGSCNLIDFLAWDQAPHWEKRGNRRVRKKMGEQSKLGGSLGSERPPLADVFPISPRFLPFSLVPGYRFFGFYGHKNSLI